MLEGVLTRKNIVSPLLYLFLFLNEITVIYICRRNEQKVLFLTN